MAESPEGGPSDGFDNQLNMSTVSSVTSNPMLNAKLVRRKVQQDMELLANRIERLKADERKARQKVMETRLRGQEIVALQKRNEQHSAAKELAKRMEEENRLRESKEVSITRKEHIGLGNRAGSRAGSRAGNRAGSRPGSSPGDRPGGRPGDKRQARPQARPQARRQARKAGPADDVHMGRTWVYVLSHPVALGRRDHAVESPRHAATATCAWHVPWEGSAA